MTRMIANSFLPALAYKAVAVAALFSLFLSSADSVAQPITAIQPANGAGGAPPALAGPMTRHFINSPNALCNDGTQAVAYLQTATAPARVNDWVFLMEGGGSCTDGTSCLRRWQGEVTEPDLGIQKMSTSIPRATWNAWNPNTPNGWTAQTINGVAVYAMPPRIAPGGILSNVAANPFSGWNKVFLNYCSSDNFLGQNPLFEANDVTDRAGAPVDFDIQFRGADIFDGLIADLRTRVTCPVGVACQRPLSLNSANTIVLAGSSAGSQGAQDTLDRFREDQAIYNAQTRVRGVFDAGSGPLRSSFPYSVALTGFVSYEAQMLATWDQMQSVWNARTDASCIAENAELPSRCADHLHLQRHHITTSFFFHTDILDKVAGPKIYANFYPDALIGGLYLPGTAAWMQSNGGLANMRELHMLRDLTARRYPAEYNAITLDPQWIAPGIFAPRCKGHVALMDGSGFLYRTIDVAGVPTNLATAIATWLSGVPFAAYATAGTIAMPPAVCPP